jgi:hypothetical protein|nr:MAG TPA: hypothetical protein [Caudoviricetes sp.]
MKKSIKCLEVINYGYQKIKTLLNSKAEADHTHTVLMDYSYDTTTQSLVINQLVCEASQ